MEGLVPPPLGAFAGGAGARGDRRCGLGRFPSQRCGGKGSVGGVGDGELIGGPGDGDQAAVVQPVVVGADQYQVADK